MKYTIKEKRMGFYEYMLSDLTLGGFFLGILLLLTAIVLIPIAIEDSIFSDKQKIKQQMATWERIERIAQYDFENPDNTLSTHQILRKYFSEESITPELLETFQNYYTMFLRFELQDQYQELEDPVEEEESEPEEKLTVTFQPKAQHSIDKIEAIRKTRLHSIQQKEELMQQARNNIT